MLRLQRSFPEIQQCAILSAILQFLLFQAILVENKVISPASITPSLSPKTT